MADNLEFEVMQSAPHIVLKSCSNSIPKKLFRNDPILNLNPPIGQWPIFLNRSNSQFQDRRSISFLGTLVEQEFRTIWGANWMTSRSRWPAILNLNLPIGQWPIFLNRSNSLWQATLNFISVNLNLMLFWNPAENWFWQGILEILNSSAYDRPPHR